MRRALLIAAALVMIAAPVPAQEPPPTPDRPLADAAQEVLGPGKVEWLEQPSLGAEDFAELLQGIRGTMFRLGVAGPGGCSPLHSNTFNPDEGSIAVGIQVLSLSLLRWMAARALVEP